MPEDEHRRLERFGRLQPPSFSGAEGEDAQGFLDDVRGYSIRQTNVVADALSRRAESLGSLAYLLAVERPLALDVQALASQERQYEDPHLLVLKDTVHHSDAKEVTIGDDGALRIHGRLCVPNVDGLRELILQEAYSSRYYIHPVAAKMYQDLRQH
ncbi:uncharacterized protein [Nicotiana tomentosiformis]|uniref:uncharacterized protein n=1 Tax=Nicotiana tomentosiformis TaxID=4098 RepID=UPI00388CB28D